MALSYHSNWGAFQAQQLPPADTLTPDFLPPMELRPELHHFSPVDCSSDVFYSQPSAACIHYDYYPPAPYDNSFESLSAPMDNIYCDHLQFPSPKRHKGCDDHYETIFPEFIKPDYFQDVVGPNPNFPNCSPPGIEVPPLPDFQGWYHCDAGGVVKKDAVVAAASGSLSAQSIAARQRRRKITEKTQELGKLVPGGQKMNTAEMLQSAYKYIKFLQAQVGILELFNSCNQEEEYEELEGEEEEEVENLVESPLIQEKLYSAEKCLVPRKFVEQLKNDEEIVKWNPGLDELAS